MDYASFNKSFWRHYIILEEEFIKTLIYVDLDRKNFDTFSVKYNSLLQSVGSEFDVICKEICTYYNEKDKGKIHEYAEAILPRFEELGKIEVIINDDNDFVIKPLEEWQIEPEYFSPTWWKSYNAIKHDRTNNIEAANLSNVLYALASLYLIEMFFVYEISTLNNEKAKIPNVPSSLFDIKDWIVNQKMIANNTLFEF